MMAKPQSSICGKITEIILAINLDERAALEGYRFLLKAFDLDVVFILLIKAQSGQTDNTIIEEIQAQWERILASTNRDSKSNQIIIVPFDGHSNSIWIQDPFFVLNDKDGMPILLRQRKSARDHSAYAQKIAEVRGYSLRTASLAFKGGNILAVDDCLLVGKDMLSEQPANLKMGEDELCERLRADFGVQKVLLIGGKDKLVFERGRPSRYQPFFHIDLFMCPGGVGPDKRSIMVLAELKDEYMVGRVRPWYWDTYYRNLSQALGEVHSQLAAAGFVVVRMPIVLETRKGGYTTFSFHNLKVEAFFENGEEKKRAYLPDYSLVKQVKPEDEGLEAALRAAHNECRDILKEISFQVKPIQSNVLRLFSKSRGSLHCIAKAFRHG